SPSALPSASPTPSASPSPSDSPSPTPPPVPSTSPAAAWPDATNTGVPAGTVLHPCPSTITAAGTYDACQFAGDLDIRVPGVTITRSEIDGQVASNSTGLVISDSTIA